MSQLVGLCDFAVRVFRNYRFESGEIIVSADL